MSVRQYDAYLLYGQSEDSDSASLSERELERLIDPTEAYPEINCIGTRETLIIQPYPGQTATEAVQYFRKRYPHICARRDGTDIALHGTRLKRGGRLRAWTGLRKGESLCWGMDAGQAARIAHFLEGRGIGRFIVFEDHDGYVWIRRAA